MFNERLIDRHPDPNRFTACLFDNFDEWVGPGTSEAVEMGEPEFVELINRAMLPWSRKIEDPDWLDLLVR